MSAANMPLTAGPLMLDLEGPQLSEDEHRLLRHPAVGGIILFSRNYQHSSQLQALTAQIRAIRPELLIAVDHEGGRVQRFREQFTLIPPMAKLGQWYRTAADKNAALQLIVDCGWLLAAELIAHGIDISFTPVLDLDRGISRVIGDRAFAADPAELIRLSRALMLGMHEAGMATTAKHFPGHGAVEADSHLEIPIDTRSYDEIAAVDMQPFQQLAGECIDAIMPAHVIYSACDASPAGFSPFWLQRVLRQQLGFTGVIFSDDLSMEAAGVAGDYAQRAEQALAAGCDMVLACNNRTGAMQVLHWLESQPIGCDKVATMKAVGPLDLEQLQQSPRWHQTRQALSALGV